jgi:hypothetical protein
VHSLDGTDKGEAVNRAQKHDRIPKELRRAADY